MQDIEPREAVRRTAGDDYIAFQPVRLIKTQIKAAERMSAKISDSKTHATAWGALYCEEVVFIPDKEYLGRVMS